MDDRIKNLEIVVSELQRTIQDQEIDIENMKEVIINMSTVLDNVRAKVKKWPFIEVQKAKDEF